MLAVAAAVALAAVAAWWLVAEPVGSRVLWSFDPQHNHGVEYADLPGLAGILASGWLGLRGLLVWRRFRRPVTAPGAR
jgi:hypothetical protein